MGGARTPTERNLSDDLSKPVCWDTIKDHRFELHGMDMHPDGSPSFVQIPNPSSKIKAPTPPTSSRKVRKSAIKVVDTTQAVVAGHSGGAPDHSPES